MSDYRIITFYGGPPTEEELQRLTKIEELGRIRVKEREERRFTYIGIRNRTKSERKDSTCFQKSR